MGQYSLLNRKMTVGLKSYSRAVSRNREKVAILSFRLRFTQNSQRGHLRTYLGWNFGALRCVSSAGRLKISKTDAITRTVGEPAVRLVILLSEPEAAELGKRRSCLEARVSLLGRRRSEPETVWGARAIMVFQLLDGSISVSCCEYDSYCGMVCVWSSI